MAQAGTNFPKVRKMLLYLSPLIFRIFLLLHGHIALAIPSLLETDPQILEHWGYADEGHLGKSLQAMDFGLECQRDVRRLLWILHIGLVSVCLSSSAKSIKTSAAPYLKYATQLSCTWWVSVQKRSPCSLMLLMPFQHGHCTFVAFFLDLLLGCSSTWRCA